MTNKVHLPSVSSGGKINHLGLLVHRLAMQLDPSRLVDAASGWDDYEVGMVCHSGCDDGVTVHCAGASGWPFVLSLGSTGSRNSVLAQCMSTASVASCTSCGSL